MTQEHYEYRTSPFFLRNQFSGEGFLEIPTIPKPNVKREDLDDLLLIGFDKVKVDDLAHKNRSFIFSCMIINLSEFGTDLSTI